MNADAARFLRFAVGLLALVMLGWVLTGQAAKPAAHHTSLPTDWTHRHLIFSQPATADALQRAAADPRYWQQQYRSVARYLSSPRGSTAHESWLSRLLHGRHRTLARDWSEFLGATASPAAAVFPAKFSFNVEEAECDSGPNPDFVVYPTGSTSTQASIVAFDNLYSGCMGTTPLVYWAYDTGGSIFTSPLFSLDGSQIAFVQTTGGVGYLVLLKWAPSPGTTISSPMTLTSMSNYRACTAPCMIALPLGTDNDTTSSPYYDYTTDTAWVGDAAGVLHEFTGVFLGTPTEVTSGFPVSLNGGTAALSNPVYDRGTNSVFVQDGGGFLYRVDASSGMSTASGQLDFGGAAAMSDGPMVDSTGGVVYVFASSDNSTSCGGTGCAAVYQLKTNFPGTNTGSEITVGSGSLTHTPSPLYSGAFDSTYLASRATGNLYVCGNTKGNPILYQVPISAGVMRTSVVGPTLSGSTMPCSPITDIQNPNTAGGPTEWIFFSVQLQGVSTGCQFAGCIFNLKVTPWTPATTYAQNDEVLDSNLNIEVAFVGGTSGGTTPSWSLTRLGSTTDGGVQWVNQSTLAHTVVPFAHVWEADQPFSLHNRVLDTHNNIEVVIVAGMSSGAVPTWPPNAGDTVQDGTVTWENLGPLASAALTAAGGTTGIIMDNFVVNSETFTGGSQIYFSTLGSQTCSGGTGNCAIQASQPELQ